MNMLIQKARRRDKAAFQQLMEAQGKAMYKVAKAILKNDEDVADAMQETALACWEKIDTLKKERFFQTWLMRILINNCNKIYRQRLKMIPDESLPEESIVDHGFANVEWEFFLNSLEEKYRIVIILYYVQGFKTREIAEILEINENTVRGRLVTARRKVADQYQAEVSLKQKSEQYRTEIQPKQTADSQMDASWVETAVLDETIRCITAERGF
jgi:RNA polymerase sigma-70 factor (ECF subfamily)